jgi:uncharacterized protein with FMN-binding domain
MRRSTAAAIGTLTGAALIVGVRLSVTPPAAPAAAPPAVDLAGNATEAPAVPAATAAAAGDKSGKAAGKPGTSTAAKPTAPAKPKSGLKDGVFKGQGANNPYGTVQVSIRIADGKIAAADATYPTTGNSATINPNAVAQLKQETLRAQSAKVAAVSGATYTSESYAKSLQSALDTAKA